MKDPIKQSLDKIRLIESEENTGFDWGDTLSSIGKFAKGKGDSLRAGLNGLSHGLTYGLDDNALAATNSFLGNEPDYKTALQNQMANNADVRSKAPNAYAVGNLAGTAASALGGPARLLPRGIGKAVGREKLGPFALSGFPAGVASTALANGLTNAAMNQWSKHMTGTKVTQSELDQLAKLPTKEIKKIQAILKVDQTGEVDFDTVKGIEKHGGIPKNIKENFIKKSDELILDEALEELNLRLFEKIFENEITEIKLPPWASKLFGKSDKPNSIIARNLDEPVKTATPDPKLGNLEPVAGKPDPKLGNSEPVAGGRQDPKWIPDSETQAKIDAARAANPPPKSPWEPSPEVLATINAINAEKAAKAAKSLPEIPKAGTPVPGKPGWIYTGKTNPNGNGRPMVKKQATTEPAAELPKSTAEPKPFQPGKRASERPKAEPTPKQNPRPEPDEVDDIMKNANIKPQETTPQSAGTSSNSGGIIINGNDNSIIIKGQDEAIEVVKKANPAAGAELEAARNESTKTGRIDKLKQWMSKWGNVGWMSSVTLLLGAEWFAQLFIGPWFSKPKEDDAETPPAPAPAPRPNPTSTTEPAAEPAPEGAPSAADLKKRISELTVRGQKSTDPDEKNIIKQLITILNLSNPDEKDLEQRSALETILATHFKQ